MKADFTLSYQNGREKIIFGTNKICGKFVCM